MDNDQANLDNGGNNDQNNDGGNTSPAWMAQLDKDLQGNERLTQFKTIGEMGKTFLELEGKSKDAVFVPGEQATDEERAEFYAKLGRPEAADKYTFGKPEDLGEDVYTPEIEAAIKGICFKANLTDAQAKVVNAEYTALLKQGHEIQSQQKAEQERVETEALSKAVDTLKNEWKGDTFKINTELATRAFIKFGGPDAKAFIETTKINGLALGDHPEFLKVFAEIGKAISDDSLNAGRDGHNNGGLSDEDKAKARFPNTYK